MKNFKVILIVLFLFYMGDRVFSKILFSSLKYSSLPIAELYFGKGKADILIIGNSRAYRHFDEKLLSNELNKKVRVLAMQGASFEFLNVLIFDYINIYGFPEKILIEVSCLSSGNDQIQNNRFMYHKSEGIRNMLKLNYKRDYIIGKLSNLFFLNTSEFLNAFHKIFVNYIQPPLFGEVSKNEIQDFMNKKYKPYFLIKNNNYIKFNNLNEKLKNDVQIISLISPTSKAIIERQVEMIPFIKRIKSVSHQNFYDFSDTFDDYKFFSDLLHLNEEGRDAFTKKIISKLFK